MEGNIHPGNTIIQQYNDNKYSIPVIQYNLKFTIQLTWLPEADDGLYRGPDGPSTAELLARTGQANMADHMRRHRVRWLGHAARKPNDVMVKQLLFAHSIPGHPKPLVLSFEQCFIYFCSFPLLFAFVVGGLGFEFCVFVAGWRHALRSEWPFIIIILIKGHPLRRACLLLV